MIIHKPGCDGIRCDCEEEHPKTLDEYLKQLKKKRKEAEEEAEEESEARLKATKIWWGLS